MPKDPILKRIGVSGYNKPKRTPKHKTKSHVVVAKVGSKIKTIRFGQQGVSGAGKRPSSKSERARKRSFKARHAKNIAKGKMSAAYWSNLVKWQMPNKAAKQRKRLKKIATKKIAEYKALKRRERKEKRNEVF